MNEMTCSIVRECFDEKSGLVNVFQIREKARESKFVHELFEKKVKNFLYEMFKLIADNFSKESRERERK